VILPRRTYSQLLGRLLHDRTADKIAQVISRLPRSAATIVPYDVPSRVAVLQSRQAAAKKAAKAVPSKPEPARSEAAVTAAEPVETPEAIARLLSLEADVATTHVPPARSATRSAPGSVAAIGSVTSSGKVTVEGRIRVVEIRPVERNSVLAVEISDHTGSLTAMFYGRSHIPGLVCGARVRLTGSAGFRDGQPVLINPAYELLFPGNGSE
jgi:hypothetical protein